MLITKTVKLIHVSEWNRYVRETYNRPYDLSEQEGRDRGIIEFVVPLPSAEDYSRTSLAKDEEGVSFATWLNRNTKEPFEPNEDDPYYIVRYFNCRFYPSLEMVIYDLYIIGLLEPGNYVINIDW